MLKRIVTVLGSSALLMLAAMGGIQAQAQARPCQPDIQKLCKDVQAGGGRLRECLKSHAAELSPGCNAMFDSNQGIFSPGGQSGRERRQGMLQACSSDLEKHCKGIEPGGGRLKECLMKHKSELSDACTKTLAALGRPRPAKPAKAATPVAKK